jgi:transcriptional regulator with XRE-family HTH domain
VTRKQRRDARKRERKLAAARPPLIGDPVIARNIKYALEAAGMLPAEFARRLEVTPQAVSQWLAAQTTPGARRLQRIADELKVSIEFLRQAPYLPQSVASPPEHSRSLHLRPYRLGEVSEQPAEECLVPAQWFRGLASDQPDLAIIHVNGRDLEPELLPGDLVVADRNWRTVSVAGIYLTGAEAFPVLRRCELIAGSENRVRIHEHGHEREMSDGLPIFGRIICKLLVPL